MNLRILSFIALVVLFYACDCQRDETTDAKAFTTDTIYDAEGALIELVHFKEDTLHYIVENYYRSGQIRFKGEYGTIKKWSIPIGEHIFFREDGTREKRITYKYENEDSELFNEIVQLQEELVFHHDGETPKQSKLFRSAPEDKRNPCGEWFEFNEEGHKKHAIIYDNDCF
ncbi:MAG: hypothetical protein LAT54_06275 [Cryomorphaceae bacterium]|nr:hypothetical protein [Cryomorphaceae bacterium]